MTVPIIPRKVLFGNPDKAMVQLSHDGAYISFLAPRDGVLNVWVAPRNDPAAARPVTNDTGRGIRFYGWAYTSQHVLYIQDKNGDENWRLYAVDLASDEIKDLTPFEGVQAQVLGTSPRFPQELIIGLNNRDPQWHDLYRLNLASGEMNLVYQNDSFLSFMIDEDLNLRGSTRMTDEGGQQMYKAALDEQAGEFTWEDWMEVPQEDSLTTNVIGFDKSGKTLFLLDSRKRNTSALVAVEVQSGKSQLLAEDPRVDAGDVVRHPSERHVQAVSFIYERKGWQVLDKAIQSDLDYLNSVRDGEVEILSRTLDDRYWIVVYVVDDGATPYYLYDREKRQASFLFTNRKDLEGQPLAKMHPVTIQSRDGLELVCYYTLPLGTDSDNDGIPDKPLPMVLFPHGGPWGRDVWGYDPFHQWLANRGYATLAVNFRSSTGFGKDFTNKGDHEWGEKILDDQVDAVRWAVQQSIADPKKVGVMGGSFGGYSTLAGLTMNPEVFACGVDLVGPSNLITLLESIPPYWKPMLKMLTSRVGDPATEEGRTLLKKHSPLSYVDNIRAPLLIGQGANDPRVKQAEADQIVQAMQAKKIPVAYALYPDEGHGFARPENSTSFSAISEAFLAKHLGGHYEPIGDDLTNSSMQMLAGVEEVPGLAEALKEVHD